MLELLKKSDEWNEEKISEEGKLRLFETGLARIAVFILIFNENCGLIKTASLN